MLKVVVEYKDNNTVDFVKLGKGDCFILPGDDPTFVYMKSNDPKTVFCLNTGNIIPYLGLPLKVILIKATLTYKEI